MSYTIQIRRDLASNWTSRNSVLASGEIGLEIDTGKAKVGNGTTAWSSLPYWVGTVPTGVALLAGSVFTGRVSPAVVQLTDAATVAIDASQGNDFRLTLAGNHTLGTPSNPADGQRISLAVTQGAGGSFVLSYSSAYEFATGLTLPTLSTAAGVTDLLGFIYNAAKSKWFFAAFINGYS